MPYKVLQALHKTRKIIFIFLMTNVVTWEALGNFSISALIEKYKASAPVSWHLTESMAASRKNGVVVLKKRRPHPIASILIEFDD